MEAIVAANHAAVEGRRTEAEFHLPPDSLPLAVLTCIDPRLNKLFPGSLGLSDEQLVWLRNAGNVITSPTSSTVRSLALACFLKGAREIAVIGHTDCKLAQFGMTALLDRMQAAGISRGALPIPNLTDFFGLFSHEKPNVIKAVGYLRTSPVIPRALPVHGLLINSATGRLEWVVNGYESTGLPLETQGATEDAAHGGHYTAGPLKTVGGQMTPLSAPEWKPVLPRIGAAMPPPAPAARPLELKPPPPPKPPPIYTAPPGKFTDRRRR